MIQKEKSPIKRDGNQNLLTVFSIQQQLVMSLEKHIPDLANFKALAQLRQKY